MTKASIEALAELVNDDGLRAAMASAFVWHGMNSIPDGAIRECIWLVLIRAHAVTREEP